MAKKNLKEGAAVNGAQKNQKPAKAAEKPQVIAPAEEKKAVSASITTTKGHVIDRISVNADPNYGNKIMVKMEYGKLDKSAKSVQDQRKNMKVFKAPLTGDALKQYQKLFETDKAAARVFAVKTMFPMHVDDKAFEVSEGVVNDQKVDYININKISEDDLIVEKLKLFDLDPEQRKAKLAELSAAERAEVLKDVKNLVGRWRLTAGEKGKTRMVAYLTPEEVASRKLRREVIKLDANRRVEKVGKPLTLVALADIAVRRAVAERQERNANIEDAKSVNWGKYHFPEGAKVSVRGPFSKNPNVLYATVNGVEISGVLSKQELTALSSKLATKEQVLMHNKDLFSKVLGANKSSYQDVRFEKAVDALVMRASDAGSKGFTKEEASLIAKALGSEENREEAVSKMWSQASERLNKAGVDEAWQADAKAELDDIAAGKWQEHSQGVSM